MSNQLYEKYQYWLNEHTKRNDKLKEYKNKQQTNAITLKQMEESIEGANMLLNSSEEQYFNVLTKVSTYNSSKALFLIEIKLKDIDEGKVLIGGTTKYVRKMDIRFL